MGEDTGDIGFGFADEGVPAEEPLCTLSGSGCAILLEGCVGGFHGCIDVVGGVGRTAGPGDISARVCLLALHGYLSSGAIYRAHTDDLEALPVLCLHPLVPDKRVKVQQRRIIELDGQLDSEPEKYRNTNLERQLGHGAV